MNEALYFWSTMILLFYIHAIEASEGKLYSTYVCLVLVIPYCFLVQNQNFMECLHIGLDGQWSSLSVVKLREKEGQRVDSGRSLKGHLEIIDCRLSISFP